MINKPEEISLRTSSSERRGEILTSMDELPTTPEIVSLGKKELQEVWKHLTEQTRQTFSGKDLKRVFSGVTPEVGGMSVGESRIPPQVLNELEEICKRFAPNILVVRHTHVQGPDDKSSYFSIVNLRSASRVIQNNPDVFPPAAQSNLKDWLKNNREEWWSDLPLSDANGDMPEIRYGVLSGFPAKSAKIFRTHCRAKKKVQLPPSLDPKMTEFFRNYTGDQLALKDDNQDLMTKLLELYGGDLSPEEKDILVRGSRVGGQVAQQGFLGIDGPKDVAYCIALDELYVQSGIDTIGQTPRQRLKSLLTHFFWPNKR